MVTETHQRIVPSEEYLVRLDIAELGMWTTIRKYYINRIGIYDHSFIRNNCRVQNKQHNIIKLEKW